MSTTCQRGKHTTAFVLLSLLAEASLASTVHEMQTTQARVTVGSGGLSAGVGSAISLLEGDVMDNYVVSIASLRIGTQADPLLSATLSITQGCGSNATTLFSKDVNMTKWKSMTVEVTGVPFDHAAWERGDDLCVKLDWESSYKRLDFFSMFVGVTFVPNNGVPELLTPALSPDAVTQHIAAGSYDGVNTTWGMNGELSSSEETYAGVITCTENATLTFSLKKNEPGFVTIHDHTGTETAFSFSGLFYNVNVYRDVPCVRGKQIFVESEQASHFSWGIQPTPVPPTAAPPTAVPTVAPTAAPPTAVPTVAPTAAPPTAVPTVAPTAAPPTAVPTVAPTAAPPTAVPTVAPTAAPVVLPCEDPVLITQFTDSSEFVSNAPLTLGGDGFIMEADVRVDGVNDMGRVFEFSNGMEKNNVILTIDSKGQWEYQVWQGAQHIIFIDPVPGPCCGVFMHVVLVVTATSHNTGFAQLFFDGVERVSASGPLPVLDTRTDNHIYTSTFPGDVPLNGVVANFSFSTCRVTTQAPPTAVPTVALPTYVWLLAGSGALLVVVLAGVLFARRRRSVAYNIQQDCAEDASALVEGCDVYDYGTAKDEEMA